MWGNRKEPKGVNNLRKKNFNPDHYDSDGNFIEKNETQKRILKKNVMVYAMKK
jgi:hypothetical protein